MHRSPNVSTEDPPQVATPPRFFGGIAKRLGEAGLAQESDTAWRRLISEKAFGHDLASARSGNREPHQHFQAQQVYRIDHDLGKEPVQDIMAYRFANATVEMDSRYENYFGNAPSTGYETLIDDCLTGDASLFRRADSIELGWEVVDPVLDVWDALPPRDFPNHPAGSLGPQAADALLTRDGRRWRSCPS
jgi:glucose-6-phosphate 1-dehydrogenase